MIKNDKFKHPFELGAEALEVEAAKSKNRKYKKALSLSAENLRKEASRLIIAFNDSKQGQSRDWKYWNWPFF